MYVCHVIPFIRPSSPLDHVPCTDVMIHNPSHLLRGSFSRSSSHSKIRTPGKMPAGEGPSAACAVSKSARRFYQNQEKHALACEAPENSDAPLHRLTLALRLHCGILPVAQEPVRALARVNRIKNPVVSTGPFLTVDR